MSEIIGMDIESDLLTVNKGEAFLPAGTITHKGQLWHIIGSIKEGDGPTFSDSFDSSETLTVPHSIKIPTTSDTVWTSSNKTITKIDTLISEQKCPHCERDWHSRALTQNMLNMFSSGQLNARYFTQQDRSRILCDGSTFIGPVRPPTPRVQVTVGVGHISIEPLLKHQNMIQEYHEALKAMMVGSNALLSPLMPDPEFMEKWFGAPQNVVKSCPGPVNLTIEWGPKNWGCEYHQLAGKMETFPSPWVEFHSAPLWNPLTHHVVSLWGQFTGLDPALIPPSKGYDFSQFNEAPKFPSKKGHKK